MGEKRSEEMAKERGRERERQWRREMVKEGGREREMVKESE